MNTTQDRFEDRLLAELTHIVTDRPVTASHPAHQSPWRRPLRLAGATAALTATAAVATAAVVVSSSTTAAPAYAVEPNPDGSLTITVHDLTDPRGLQTRLAHFGVASHVTLDRAIQGHIQRQCHLAPPPNASKQPPDLIVGAHPGSSSSQTITAPAHTNIVAINPARMPAGATLAVHIAQVLSPASPHRPIAENLRVAVVPAGATDPWPSTIPCPISTATRSPGQTN